MSTTYIPLREPITCVRPELQGGHYHVGVWINHGKSGDLVMRKDELPGFLLAITEKDIIVARTTCGGLGTGKTLEIQPRYQVESREHMQVVSERGELATLHQLRQSVQERGESHDGRHEN
jgi:hypothetical protein